MSNFETLPYVEGELNYPGADDRAPALTTPMRSSPGENRSNMAHEAHRVHIRDMRPIASEIELDRQGFALVERKTAVRDFWDDDEVRRVYYCRGRTVSHCRKDWSQPRLHLRPFAAPPRAGPDRPLGGRPRQPATRVHVDHTPRALRPAAGS